VGSKYVIRFLLFKYRKTVVLIKKKISFGTEYKKMPHLKFADLL
jgi:hypothetical protein